MLEVNSLPVLSDNYIHIIHDPVSRETAAVDPALAEPVLEFLDTKGWRLTHLFNTHHHWDHVNGNLELKQKTGCTITASEADRNRIPGIDRTVGEGDVVHLGRHKARILFTPGHTRGHIVYHFAEDRLLFCGDTLFAMGCGRLFEGTAEEMWHSLQKIKALPGDTRIYCTHEYTQQNGRFALTVEPGNEALQRRMQTVDRLRRDNRPTVPTTLAEELETNPFLREDSPALQRTLHMTGKKPAEIFAETRRLKDRF
ncbi:MAG: hydroxyacylglutathione hydrolase [Gammaproteobacteria bacterium]